MLPDSGPGREWPASRRLRAGFRCRLAGRTTSKSGAAIAAAKARAVRR
jgi:hypothetical protein